MINVIARWLPFVLLLAPVVFAGRMLTAWNRLPKSMATHFSGGQPDSYLPRLVFLLIGVAVLALASTISLRRAVDPIRQAIAAAVTVLITAAFWQVVGFNLGEAEVSITGPAIAALVTGALVALVGLRASAPDEEDSSG